jgi:hypothetical protein
VEWHWVDDVLYLEYSPVTIEYELSLDAFTLGRAEVYVPDRHDRRFCLALTIVITAQDLHVSGLSIAAAINQARTLLPRLVEEHRAAAARMTVNESYTFDLGGRRLR